MSDEHKTNNYQDFYKSVFDYMVQPLKIADFGFKMLFKDFHINNIEDVFGVAKVTAFLTATATVGSLVTVPSGLLALTLGTAVFIPGMLKDLVTGKKNDSHPCESSSKTNSNDITNDAVSNDVTNDIVPNNLTNNVVPDNLTNNDIDDVTNNVIPNDVTNNVESDVRYISTKDIFEVVGKPAHKFAISTGMTEQQTVKVDDKDNEKNRTFTGNLALSHNDEVIEEQIAASRRMGF